MNERGTASPFHDLDARAARIGALTPRERDVLAGILAGCPNKVIAHQLGISTRTVEAHRAHIMRFIGATHIAHVICAAIEAIRLGLYPESVSGFAPRLASFVHQPGGASNKPVVSTVARPAYKAKRGVK